jgi:hypothetical protein
MLTQDCGQYYLLRNRPYLKKFNLGPSDPAKFSGWEFLVKTKKYILFCILIRRQYLPPLLGDAQDIAIMLKCPTAYGKRTGGDEEAEDDESVLYQKNLDPPPDSELALECEMIADSVAPLLMSDVSIYRPIVQAKLDALRFDEDSYHWLGNYIKLIPSHFTTALTFVKSILKLLVEEKVHTYTDFY